MGPGEFCVRGEIVDIYPMGAPNPYRIGLFDDEIETIRVFDENTQHTTGDAESIRILPGREFPIDEAGALTFRKNWQTAFPKAGTRSSVYKDIANHVPSPGSEYYLPLFFDETATIFDYVGEDARFFLTGDVNAELERFYHETEGRYEFLSHDAEHPALPPEQLFLSPEAFFKALSPFARWKLVTSGDGTPVFPDLSVDRRAKDPRGRRPRSGGSSFRRHPPAAKRRFSNSSASMGSPRTGPRGSARLLTPTPRSRSPTGRFMTAS